MTRLGPRCHGRDLTGNHAYEERQHPLVPGTMIGLDTSVVLADVVVGHPVMLSGHRTFNVARSGDVAVNTVASNSAGSSEGTSRWTAVITNSNRLSG